jgi:hypothetical protein
MKSNGRAALVANTLQGAFPPVDLRAVCLVRVGGIFEAYNMYLGDIADCLPLLRLFSKAGTCVSW